MIQTEQNRSQQTK